MGVEIRGKYKTIGGFSAATPIPPSLAPEWITSAGLLTTGGEGTAISAVVEASGTNLLYEFAVAPPGGVFLNSATGAITGTFPAAYGSAGNTKDYEVSIVVSNGHDVSEPRTFILRSSYNVPATIPSSFRFTDSLNNTNGTSPFTVSGGGQATVAQVTGPNGEDSTALVMTNSTYLYQPSTGTTYSFLRNESTVEFWYLIPNPIVTGNKRVFDMSANTFGFLRLDANTGGGNDFKYHFTLGGANTTGFAEPTPGTWAHFALTHNGSGQWIQYNNGQAGSPLTRVLSATYFNNLTMSINAYGNSSTYATPTAVMRGLCFHNRLKYTANFTPEWDNFLS